MELIDQIKSVGENVNTILKGQGEAKVKADELDIKAAKAIEMAEKAEGEISEIKEEVRLIKLDSAKISKGSDEPFSMKMFDNAVAKAIEKQADEIAHAINTKGAVKLDLKAATTISTANFGAGVLQGMRLAGVDPLDRNPQTVLSEITVMYGGPGSDPFSWVEKVVKEGGAASVAESALKPFYDWTYVENKATAEMIAAIVPVTKQALLRAPMLRGHINEELIAEVREELQRQVIVGTGTSPDLKSLTYYATAFAAGTLAGKVDYANNFDAIRAIAAQVFLAKGVANVIFVNPALLASMDLVKDTNGGYVIPPFATASGTVIGGVRVVAAYDLAADAFIGGDVRRYMLNIVEDLNIEVGWINDQFQRNQLSIRGEVFAAGGMKAQHQNKLIKGTFTAVRAALETA
ncbi:MAG TPA: phage major capsid protein [Segetibacter sp.]|jgi:HK97 family phage major capsid protein